MIKIEDYIIEPFKNTTPEQKQLIGPCIFGTYLSVLEHQHKEELNQYLDKHGINREENVREVMTYIFQIVEPSGTGVVDDDFIYIDYGKEKIDLDTVLSEIKRLRDVA